MGEVRAARDLRLDRRVAVKLLSRHVAADPVTRQRFETEARSAARLNHPNVVSVYDSGEDDGVPFLVMELLPGRTLADEISEGPLDPERVRAVGLEVLAALDASHRAGVLHRDVKPGNVLLTANGTAKVADFGIAKSVESVDLTATGVVVGTAAYLAPERLAGQPATVSSDLYAVGAVLYEALTGRKPYRPDTPLAMLRAIEAGEHPPLARAAPQTDARLAATVEQAMARDAAARFPSASVMADALRGTPSRTPGPTVATASSSLAATEHLPAAEPAPTEPLPAPTLVAPLDQPLRHRRDLGGSRPRWRRRRWVLLATVALGLAAVVAFAATRGDPSSPEGHPPTSAVPSTNTTLPERLAAALDDLDAAVRR